jgi:hypothetical protein
VPLLLHGSRGKGFFRDADHISSEVAVYYFLDIFDFISA